MNKFYTLIAAIIALCSLSLASCDKENSVEFNQSDREYLEQTANTFLSYFNPNDQRTAMTSLHEFVKLCQEYTLPDNYVDSRYYDLQKAVSAFARAAESQDYLSMSRATTEIAYNMARFKGLYQANTNTRTWDWIEDRDYINFRFWIGSTQYNLSLQGSGGSWSGSYTDTNTGYNYLVEAPKNLILNMTSGTTSFSNVFNATINSDVKDDQYANITVDVTFANILVNTSIKATPTSIREETTLQAEYTSSQPRTTLLTSETTISGRNLCSASVWGNIIETESDSQKTSLICDIVSTFSNTLMLMQRVQLKTSSSNISTLIDYIDRDWDNTNSSNPEKDAKDAATRLSGSITSSMFYTYADDSRLVRGTLGWEAYQLDDIDYDEWSVRPTITLTSDGSVTDFESFFGNGRFYSVERTFNSLMNAYKNYWK